MNKCDQICSEIADKKVKVKQAHTHREYFHHCVPGKPTPKRKLKAKPISEHWEHTDVQQQSRTEITTSLHSSEIFPLLQT